jgi:hypothetical protein
MENPERFAAISPRDGIGEPYRAVRLRGVPAWVIHGEKDDVLFTGYADQMVAAMRAHGGTANYTVIPNAPHNVPPDFDQSPIIKWYLLQHRHSGPVPPDPRDGLGIGSLGFSPWTVATKPGGVFWRSPAFGLEVDVRKQRPAEWPLFREIQDRGLLVDSPIRRRVDQSRASVTFWLAAPPALANKAKADTNALQRGPLRVAEYFYKGAPREGLAHAAQIAPQLAAAGLTPSGVIWVTPLSLWQDTARGIAEYWVELK